MACPPCCLEFAFAMKALERAGCRAGLSAVALAKVGER